MINYQIISSKSVSVLTSNPTIKCFQEFNEVYEQLVNEKKQVQMIQESIKPSFGGKKI